MDQKKARSFLPRATWYFVVFFLYFFFLKGGKLPYVSLLSTPRLGPLCTERWALPSVQQRSNFFLLFLPSFFGLVESHPKRGVVDGEKSSLKICLTVEKTGHNGPGSGNARTFRWFSNVERRTPWMVIRFLRAVGEIVLLFLIEFLQGHGGRRTVGLKIREGRLCISVNWTTLFLIHLRILRYLFISFSLCESKSFLSWKCTWKYLRPIILTEKRNKQQDRSKVSFLKSPRSTEIIYRDKKEKKKKMNATEIHSFPNFSIARSKERRR